MYHQNTTRVITRSYLRLLLPLFCNVTTFILENVSPNDDLRQYTARL